MDSTKDTLKHIKQVNEYLLLCIIELSLRAREHDESKLETPEKELFDKYTDKLKSSTYGSDEYYGFLEGLKPALEHHYKMNPHHPEHVFSNEEWKSIEGYEGVYEISNRGRVKSLEREIKRKKQGNFIKKESILKPSVTPKGYARAQLRKNGSYKHYFVHVLVAEAFVPNPENKPQVNHIDGIKLNNYRNNLEWVTPSENLIHAYDEGLKEGCVKYVVRCKELDITTFGTTKMESKLKERGYARASSAGIWRCVNSDKDSHSHLDLHFESWNINEYKTINSPIKGMNLFDLLEMIMDWKAATERHDDGDIHKSIEINQDRFEYSNELKRIFSNTVKFMGW